MENNMKTLTPVPDEVEKTRDVQGKESDKGTGKGGLGNTPTILASICAICWIGLIAVVTFMWLKNGDRFSTHRRNLFATLFQFP